MAKKQKVHETDDSSVKIINKLSVERLKGLKMNYFSSTYGFLCMFNILRNGTHGKVRENLNKLLGSKNLININAEDLKIFKNI